VIIIVLTKSKTLKLIETIFMYILSTVSAYFSKGGKAIGDNTQDISQFTIIQKTKNIWENHKGKILLSLGTMGLIGIGYYYYSYTNSRLLADEVLAADEVKKTRSCERKL